MEFGQRPKGGGGCGPGENFGLKLVIEKWIQQKNLLRKKFFDEKILI